MLGVTFWMLDASGLSRLNPFIFSLSATFSVGVISKVLTQIVLIPTVFAIHPPKTISEQLITIAGENLYPYCIRFMMREALAV